MKIRKKKYCCRKCDKKTVQTKFSEGITENIYYLDYKCDVCGTINPFKASVMHVLQEKTQFCFRG